MIPLAIGTAQFGQKYGICNKDGAVEGNIAQGIIDLAISRGIDYFDTAKLYGESESVLGSALHAKKDVHIITKLTGDSAAPESMRHDFEDSLRCLGREQLHAVLIHNAQSLLDTGGERIWNELRALKDKGLVREIGISVYTPDEFIMLANRFEPDIVQVPCNILDQRFLTQEVQERKKCKNIKFHARSLFLQGILANLPEGIPPFMKDRSSLFEHISKTAADNGMTVLEFCLSFALSFVNKGMIDRWVIGVDSSQQLADIVDCAQNTKLTALEWVHFATEVAEIIDPRQWKRSAV